MYNIERSCELQLPFIFDCVQNQTLIGSLEGVHSRACTAIENWRVSLGNRPREAAPTTNRSLPEYVGFLAIDLPQIPLPLFGLNPCNYWTSCGQKRQFGFPMTHPRIRALCPFLFTRWVHLFPFNTTSHCPSSGRFGN